MKKRGMILPVVLAAVMLAALTGCSRSELNYQIAESIGTLGMYENNEPVETPKMKAEREQRESESELEAERQEVLASAEALATEYRYEDAISRLQNSDIMADDSRTEEAIADYQSRMSELYQYSGDIPHFSFTNLVVDTSMAFDGDEYEYTYRSNMITITEFERILQALYDDGYILIDIHSLAEESGSGDDLVMSAANPTVPEGKKPMILSVDNLTYSSVRNGDGVATKLTVGSDGEVDALYTDSEGHDKAGDYDVIPVLEAFIDEHPDFSYQGARGIVSVSGSSGAFGYSLTSGDEANTENQQTVKEIADALKNQGWTLASAGYSYQYMADMNYDTLSKDMTDWLNNIGSLFGDCDTLIYPYGSEVDYSSEKGAFLTNRGFHYLIGMWTDGDHTEVNPTYLRQTRRMVTGYVFTNASYSFQNFFSVQEIMDPAR